MNPIEVLGGFVCGLLTVPIIVVGMIELSEYRERKSLRKAKRQLELFNHPLTHTKGMKTK